MSMRRPARSTVQMRPPTRSRASRTQTSLSARAMSRAATRPAYPAPTTHTSTVTRSDTTFPHLGARGTRVPGRPWQLSLHERLSWATGQRLGGRERAPEQRDRPLDRLRLDVDVRSLPHTHPLRTGDRGKHFEGAV